MKARIQAGLCVILDIYNTFGNDSFALLMNAGYCQDWLETVFKSLVLTLPRLTVLPRASQKSRLR